MVLRGAIVGFGFIAEKGHLPSYRARPEIEIVAVADRCAARRERARALLPNARIYQDHETLLAAERLDFVDVATPPSSHAAIAHAALERRLHVLCEKPLATSAADAESMIEHARRARRVLFPGHNYKHAPVVRAVRELLAADRIGAVRLATLDTFRTGHARGVVEWRPDWRRDRALAGGGIAMDHGCHTFYLAFEWLRSYPTAIAATASGGEVEDDFGCTLTFPTGTAMARLTWNAGFRKTLYTLHGERGAIKIEDDEIELSTGEKWTVPSRWSDAGHADWFGPLVEEFLAAIDSDRFVGEDAREALLCVQLIEAAYRSARDGAAALDPRARVAIA